MELYGQEAAKNGSQPEWSSAESLQGMSLWGRVVYPERPGMPDCAYYMRTGVCGYGTKCRYNHPRDRSHVEGAVQSRVGEYPERVGEPTCQYYIRTGTCKFGASCKFDHPRNAGGSFNIVPLNVHGYPLRPEEKECSYYLQTGQCKFGKTCKFHHPQPSGMSSPAAARPFYPTMQNLPSPSAEQHGGASTSYRVARPPALSGSYVPGYSPMLYHPGVLPFPNWSAYAGPPTPGAQAAAGEASSYGMSQLATSAPLPGTYPPFISYLGHSGSTQKEQPYPIRPGQPECQYYMKTGDCKFGSSCRYHHPPEVLASKTNCLLNPKGLPLRPGVQPCTFYMQKGHCKFGRSCKYDHAISKKLRTMTYSTEEQVRAQNDQTKFLFQLAGRTTPKGLHCLSMRLTSDFFALLPDDRELPNQHKLNNPSLYHFAVFSDNVLACAVVVNSTVLAAQEPEKIVFHIVTDSLNLPAMTMWFLLNPPEKATVHVQSVDNFGWLSVKYEANLPKQASLDLRFTSPLNHLRFYLPDVFPRLKKIVFLDHDVVVRRDLKALWEVNMKGKVNGAVETCQKGEPSYRQMDMFINFTDPIIAKRFDANTCTWAFGMNIFDLQKWRKQDLTQVYHKYLAMGSKGPLIKAGTLPIGWMTFYNQTVALNRRFHSLGLGHDHSVKRDEVEQASVLHFDGIMKPWLDIGIDVYKQYWKKYVDYQHSYLQQCNIQE